MSRSPHRSHIIAPPKRSKTPARRSAATKRHVQVHRPWHVRLALHPLTVFMLLVAGVLIIGWTLRAAADSYTVTAKVPAPALTEGAVITSPSDGSTAATGTIAINGTCPNDSYVTLIRNGIFSGVAACAGDNTFSITTSISTGANLLVAQAYNITDDPGPATPGITIHYNPPTQAGSTSSQGSGNTSNPSAPLLLASDYRFQAVAPGNTFRWTVGVRGGTAPYTLTTDWGDNGQTVQVVQRPQNVTISHDYTSPGYFTILVNTTDARQNTVTLQLVAFIKQPGTNGILFQNGNTDIPAPGNALLDTLTSSKWLLVAWPSYVIVSLMVASFWLGERQEIRQIFARDKLRTHPGSR